MKNATKSAAAVEISESARADMVRSVNEALASKEAAERAAERPAPAAPVETPFTPLTMEDAKALLTEATGFKGERQRLALASLIRNVVLSEYVEPKKGQKGKVFGPCYAISAEGVPLRMESELSSDADFRKGQIQSIRDSRKIAAWIRGEVKKIMEDNGIAFVTSESLHVSATGAIAHKTNTVAKMSAPRGMACKV